MVLYSYPNINKNIFKKTTLIKSVAEKYRLNP